MPGQPLEPGRPFPGWEALRGNIVVVDFWATWCGPCLPGLDKLAGFEKEFAGEPIRFFTVASDEAQRVRKYFAEKRLKLDTFVQPEDGKGLAGWGISTLPAAVIIGRDGRVLAVTPGENLTDTVLRAALRGETLDLPPFRRENNIAWDTEEILWQDGVQPLFQVVIKPIQVSGGGQMYRPGSNRISGDGALLGNMIQAAWQTDRFHLDPRFELPRQTFRFAARVPEGRESELLPALRDALQRTFAIRVEWEEQFRDVLVLSRNETAQLRESEASAALYMFRRGKITLRKQTTARLTEALPNWLRKVVVDETGLKGQYDFDLEYSDGSPTILTDGLQRNYGLVLTPGKRRVHMLVVDRKD
jgi:uncharacterized protein (TIGR03435 family)